jgi:hypothetical protein
MHVDSDVYRFDIATHSLLGGQHGEESEESEEGQEEGQEEEVVLLLCSTTRSTVMSTQRRKGRRGKTPWRNAAEVATSALVDDGGRRRNRDLSFTGSVFWSGFTGWI